MRYILLLLLTSLSLLSSAQKRRDTTIRVTQDIKTAIQKNQFKKLRQQSDSVEHSRHRDSSLAAQNAARISGYDNKLHHKHADSTVIINKDTVFLQKATILKRVAQNTLITISGYVVLKQVGGDRPEPVAMFDDKWQLIKPEEVFDVRQRRD